MVMNKMFILMLFLFPLGLLCFWFLFTSDDTQTDFLTKKPL